MKVCLAVMVATLCSVAGQEECSDKKQGPRPPRIQLRSILIRCPYRSGYNTYKNVMEDPDVDLSRDKEILQFYGFDVDEPLLHSEVVRCRRKLVITIKLNNCGKHKKETEYVVIDHAYDPTSKEKIRLLNPIVLKIVQDAVMQAYPMNFVHVVNAEATEEVINKGNKRNYKGCSTYLSNPTCGLAHYDGKKIPYSEGFCCSCDSEVNLKRQPVGPTISEPNRDIAYLLEGGKMPQDLKARSNKTTKLKRIKNQKCKPDSHIRGKRAYPLKYYQFPPMEPAKGFVWSDFKGSTGVDPWEAAAPESYYLKKRRPRSTTYNPFYHVLQKRLGVSLIQDQLIEANDYYVNSTRLPSILNNAYFANDIGSKQLQKKNSNFSNNFGVGKARVQLSRMRKRQVTASGTQVRGGQDCIERETPISANPITYHESAHCLRFSELWYSVYNLKEPFTAHSVHIDIFEKHCTEHRKNLWITKTERLNATVGSYMRRVMDALPTIVFSYTPLQTIDSEYVCLDAAQAVLLVPRPLDASRLTEYPQPAEPSGRYLLVSQSDVSTDGDECDKIGVSYGAFATQPGRCEKPKGTCLANQPLDMWKHDTVLKAKGEKGKYFLENYADVPEKAVEEAGGKKFLNLYYEGPHSSVIEIEYNADSNGIIRKESTVQISEMYVDSTCEYHTRITILVTNNGLVSSMFRPRMTNCPVTIPSIWSHEEGPLALIAPQRKHVFRLSLYGPLPSSRFYCTIEILNCKRKIVALRRIRMQKYDRCLCMWHCLCACAGSIEAFKCNPMSLEHFHAAGFYGSMSMDTSEFYSDKKTFSSSVFLGKLLTITFGMHVFLLFFGLIKAIIGLCFSRKIATYYLQYVCPNAVRDFQEESDQSRKKRKCLLRSLEFFYNTICFLVMPGWLFINFIIHLIQWCFDDHSGSSKKNPPGEKKKQNFSEKILYIVTGKFFIDLIKRIINHFKKDDKNKSKKSKGDEGSEITRKVSLKHVNFKGNARSDDKNLHQHRVQSAPPSNTGGKGMDKNETEKEPSEKENKEVMNKDSAKNGPSISRHENGMGHKSGSKKELSERVDEKEKYNNENKEKKESKNDKRIVACVPGECSSSASRKSGSLFLPQKSSSKPSNRGSNALWDQ